MHEDFACSLRAEELRGCTTPLRLWKNCSYGRFERVDRMLGTNRPAAALPLRRAEVRDMVVGGLADWGRQNMPITDDFKLSPWLHPRIKPGQDPGFGPWAPPFDAA